jgi:hypothetical protein
MKATTVKLDGPILDELLAMKASDQNLTSLVRDLLREQLQRRRMAQAAEEYAAFLRQNPEESQELDVWASAPLERDPQTRDGGQR